MGNDVRVEAITKRTYRVLVRNDHPDSRPQRAALGRFRGDPRVPASADVRQRRATADPSP